MPDMQTIISLAKRRGFIYPGSLLYGGLESSYDYGPMGVQMKMNIKRLWWQRNVESREDIVGLDSSIFLHPKVWEASGHIGGFHDMLVECKKCHKRYRVDHVPAENVANNTCPECKGELSKPKQFNLMFRTSWGPVESDESRIYMRPETAQGIFINYKNVRDSMRVELPFGIAQIGKAFRNEITTGNFIFRMREFEQMEIEFFTPADRADEWFARWKEERLQWYKDLGVSPARLRLRDHRSDELAHYAKAASDIEYEFPFGWGEIEGIVNRQAFDLKQHEKFSGEKIEDPLPYVIEPSCGVDRLLAMFLIDAYGEEKVASAGKGDGESKGEGETRVVLKLHPELAPYQIAVFPLLRNKPELVVKAREVYELVRHTKRAFYDEKGAIGRRYRRQDEIGTPKCITIDFETLENNTVTVRDRDSMKQARVKIDRL